MYAAGYMMPQQKEDGEPEKSHRSQILIVLICLWDSAFTRSRNRRILIYSLFPQSSFIFCSSFF